MQIKDTKIERKRDETIEVFESVFQHLNTPLILCDSDGRRCRLNREAEQLFSSLVIGNITDIFPDLILNTKSRNTDIADKWGNIHQLTINYIEEEKHYLINLNRETSDWEEFMREQKILGQVYEDLSSCRSEKEIFHKVVLWGRNDLHIDRIGIILISPDRKHMFGSWGTNDAGEIIDQSYFEADVEDEEWALGAIANRNNVMVQFDSPLKNEGEEVGVGWNSHAAFFDRDELIGWIACDNLISHTPLPRWKMEILGELARMTGRFVSKFRQENRLQELIIKKTEELKISQKQLIESEKMAALGSLVAGIAHEINTPLGIAITANSFLAEIIEKTKHNLDEGSLKKSALNYFFDKLSESRKIISDSLAKTVEHISKFKKLAIDTTSEDYTLFNLQECFSSIIKIHGTIIGEKNISVQFKLDDSLQIWGCQSDFLLIFTNLIENSIKHGFKSASMGIIGLDARKENNDIIIEYWDNGMELNDDELENIFTPFYTTGRHLGQAGLGLTIIYNMVYKYGGTITPKSLHPGLLLQFRFKGMIQF
jgi:signal transduction histidine kinase